MSQSTFPSHQQILGSPLITDDFESLFYVTKKLSQSDRSRGSQLLRIETQGTFVSAAKALCYNETEVHNIVVQQIDL